MELPIIDLPSTKGARLTITAKTYANISRQVEEASVELRSAAHAGTSHPRTVVKFITQAAADLEALRIATEAEIDAIDTAIAVLDGAHVGANQHPLIATAAEMKFTAAAFSEASSDIVREKAAGLIEETRAQLKGTRDAAQRAIEEHAHRLDAVRRKAADALRVSIATYTGPYRISLKEAGQLLNLDSIPADDTPLPAPSYDPRLPGDHPARAAAVLQTICKTREAQAQLMAEHRAAKVAMSARKRTVTDDVRDGLKLLGDV